jgi:SSS family solute:Na+ symporter
MLTKAPPKEKEKYTAFGATPEQKAASRASWNKWDVIHTLVVIGVIVVFYWSFW